MRIAHICLCGPFAEHMSYQENELVREHTLLGHDVTVIATTDTYDLTQRLSSTIAGTSTLNNGATLVRLPYLALGISALYRRLRAFKGLRQVLEKYEPEVILFHGLCAWALIEVSRYAQSRPSVKLYADSHEDFNNSARTFASKWLLHYLYYRTIFQLSLINIRRVLCVSKETEDFVRSFYGCPPALIEYFPLGGIPLDHSTYLRERSSVRNRLNLRDDNRVFIQTGKFDRLKKLEPALEAFTKTKDAHLRFLVAGQLMPDVEASARHLIESDPRIVFLGWQSADSLRGLLCAADVYVQPGSQSATLQMALCCRRPVIVDDVPSHRVFVQTNGWLAHDFESLERALATAARMGDAEISRMSAESAQVASTLLDYREQAKRLLRDE
jgi:1,2-diacylglycerol 3-alpha-glucosyltransferase